MLDWDGCVGQYPIATRRMLPEIVIDCVVKERSRNCAVAQSFNTTATCVDSDDVAFAVRMTW
jgi:hypothetical protein